MCEEGGDISCQFFISDRHSSKTNQQMTFGGGGVVRREEGVSDKMNQLRGDREGGKGEGAMGEEMEGSIKGRRSVLQT